MLCAIRIDGFQCRLLCWTLAVCSTGLLHGNAAAAGFHGLGQISGDSTYLRAAALSADGSTVVGRSGVLSNSIGPGEAFRWTRDIGAVGLGTLISGPGPIGSIAADVSADGSVVVGSGSWGDPLPGLPRPVYADTPFYWTESTGLVPLDHPGITPAINDSAIAVTSDGARVLVNLQQTGLNWWNLADTLSPVTGVTGPVNGISADGTAAAGFHINPASDNGPSVQEAVRWLAEPAHG